MTTPPDYSLRKIQMTPRRHGKTQALAVDRATVVMSDRSQAEQLVREHLNLSTLCNDLKAKGVKQRQEIARLTREVEQLHEDKSLLAFDLNKERALTRLLREKG